MALQTYTLTGPIGDLTAAPLGRGARVVIKATDKLIPDVSTGGVRMGEEYVAEVNPATGGISVALPATVDGFPLYRVIIEQPGGQHPRQAGTGYFEMTANRTLAWAVQNSVNPATIDATVVADIAGAKLAVDQIEAIREEIAQITEPLTAPTVQAVAGFVRNPGPVRDELAATFAPKPGLIDLYEAPGSLVVAHRGGYLYPEHSMEGYRAVVAAGFVPEVDLYALADGTLVPLHDTTVDRTTTGTGTIVSKTLAQWKALRIKAPVAGQRQAVPPTWEEVLTELGGRSLLVVEVRTGTVDAFIESVQRRGLERSVFVSSFDRAHVIQTAAAGIPSGFITDSVIDFAALRADGIDWVATSLFGANRAALLAAAAAAGVKALVYGITTSTQTAAVLAEGAHAVMAGDPQAATGQYAAQTTDPHAGRVAWPGYKAGGAGAWATALGFHGPREFGRMGHTASTDSAVVNLGWAGKRPSLRMEVEGTLRFGPSASGQDRWAGLAIGTWTDLQGMYLDTATADQSAYHILIRRNGALGIYKNLPGGTGLLIASSTPTTPIAASGAGGSARIRVTITATDVTVTNLTDGTTATVANTEVSRAVPGRIAMTWAGSDAVWSDMSVRDL